MSTTSTDGEGGRERSSSPRGGDVDRSPPTGLAEKKNTGRFSFHWRDVGIDLETMTSDWKRANYPRYWNRGIVSCWLWRRKCAWALTTIWRLNDFTAHERWRFKSRLSVVSSRKWKWNDPDVVVAFYNVVSFPIRLPLARHMRNMKCSVVMATDLELAELGLMEADIFGESFFIFQDLWIGHSLRALLRCDIRWEGRNEKVRAPWAFSWRIH